MVYALSLIAIIVSLCLVVGIHEAGHAVIARLFRIRIQKISIGFGRPILCWQGKNGVQWVWALWPLGGYVQLCNTRVQTVAPEEYAVCFDKKPIWMRCLVLLSGAAANVLVAWLALLVFFMIGYQQHPPILETVTKPSVAATAGLHSGDRIIRVGDKPVSSWREVGMGLIVNLGQTALPIVVKREGATQTLSIDMSQWSFHRGKNALLGAIGIGFDTTPQSAEIVPGRAFLAACQQAFFTVCELLCFFFTLLKLLLTGVLPFTILLGPLGMFQAMIGSFMQGFSVFLSFIANISLAVALINLLPIPGLDGGSILYALIEKIRGKPMSIAMEVLLYRLTFIALCLVLVQLLLNDMHR